MTKHPERWYLIRQILPGVGRVVRAYDDPRDAADAWCHWGGILQPAATFRIVRDTGARIRRHTLVYFRTDDDTGRPVIVRG